VINAMRTGYPRFFFHPLINQIRAEHLRTQDGIEGWRTRIPMDQGQGFMRVEVELVE
jgi:hypothetical protein